MPSHRQSNRRDGERRSDTTPLIALTGAPARITINVTSAPRERTTHGARECTESKQSRQAAPARRRSHLTWRRRSTRGARACRRGHRDHMPPRRGTGTAHIDDDDDADPRASPFPPSHLAAPRYVAVAAAITAPPRRRTCFHARRAPWEMRAQGQSCSVSRERCHVAILNSSRDHRRGFVRHAARKLKFHVEGVLARGRRAEKPPFARALSRPTNQTSRCDAVMNRDERQTIDTGLGHNDARRQSRSRGQLQILLHVGIRSTRSRTLSVA
jgi:hypothetical protein